MVAVAAAAAALSPLASVGPVRASARSRATAGPSSVGASQDPCSSTTCVVKVVYRTTTATATFAIGVPGGKSAYDTCSEKQSLAPEVFQGLTDWDYPTTSFRSPYLATRAYTPKQSNLGGALTCRANPATSGNNGTWDLTAYADGEPVSQGAYPQNPPNTYFFGLRNGKYWFSADSVWLTNGPNFGSAPGTFWGTYDDCLRLNNSCLSVSAGGSNVSRYTAALAKYEVSNGTQNPYPVLFGVPTKAIGQREQLTEQFQVSGKMAKWKDPNTDVTMSMSWSGTVRVTISRASILQNGDLLQPGVPSHAVVGQHLDLSTVMGNATNPVSHVRWVIAHGPVSELWFEKPPTCTQTVRPGNPGATTGPQSTETVPLLECRSYVLADYVRSAASKVALPVGLSKPGTERSFLPDVYFVRGGTYHVMVSGTSALGGYMLTSAVIDVRSPEITQQDVQMCKVDINTRYTINGSEPPWLGLGWNNSCPWEGGGLNTGSRPGIGWEVRVAGPSGQLGMIQLLGTNAWKRYYAGPVEVTRTCYNYALGADLADASLFYDYVNVDKHTEAHPQSPVIDVPGQWWERDSPFISLRSAAGVAESLVVEKYKAFVAMDYLMFRPAGTANIWVPIAHPITWSWHGLAGRSLLGRGRDTAWRVEGAKPTAEKTTLSFKPVQPDDAPPTVRGEVPTGLSC